jgi:protein-tyrosine phosphatase
MNNLDYSKGSVNLRDVGEFVNLLSGRTLLTERKLWRGGKLDFVSSAKEICFPRTIINLRNSPDPNSFGAKAYHFPLDSRYDKYETHRAEVRQWLQNVIKVFEAPDLAFPMFIHCNSGKDRTGVVVAALLKIAGIPDEIIVEEYMLSDGDVQEDFIRQALAGFADVEKYFQRVNLNQVRHHLIQTS